MYVCLDVCIDVCTYVCMYISMYLECMDVWMYPECSGCVSVDPAIESRIVFKSLLFHVCNVI